MGDELKEVLRQLSLQYLKRLSQNPKQCICEFCGKIIDTEYERMNSPDGTHAHLLCYDPHYGEDIEVGHAESY